MIRHSTFGLGIEKRAAKNYGVIDLRLASIYDGFDSTAAGIVTDVAAGLSDPTTKAQLAGANVENHLTGCVSAKQRGVRPVTIDNRGDPWDHRSAVPKIRPIPVSGRTLRNCE